MSCLGDEIKKKLTRKSKAFLQKRILMAQRQNREIKTTYAT